MRLALGRSERRDKLTEEGFITLIGDAILLRFFKCICQIGTSSASELHLDNDGARTLWDRYCHNWREHELGIGQHG